MSYTNGYSIEHLIVQLKKLVEFLTPLLPLANSHLVQFISQDQWNEFLLPGMQRDLLDVPYNTLNLISTADLYEQPVGGVSPGKQLWDCHFQRGEEKEKKTEDNGTDFCSIKEEIHSSLQHFLLTVKGLRAANLNILSPLPELLNNIDDQDAKVIDGSMNQKKAYEVKITSRLITAICKDKNPEWIVDIGSGLGYLSSTLLIQHGFKVFALDSSKSNIASALKQGQMMKNLFERFKDSCSSLEKIRKNPKNVPKNLYSSTSNSKLDASNPVIHTQSLISNNRISNSDKYDKRNLEHYNYNIKQDKNSKSNIQDSGSTQNLKCDTSFSGLETSKLEHKLNAPNLKHDSHHVYQTNAYNLKSDSDNLERGAYNLKPDANNLKPDTNDLNHYAYNSKYDTHSSDSQTNSSKPYPRNKVDELLSFNAFNGTFLGLTKYITNDQNLPDLISSFQENHNERDFGTSLNNLGLVGLHTCGNLSSTSLSLFVNNPSAQFLCNIGCCYHLITERFCEDYFVIKQKINDPPIDSRYQSPELDPFHRKTGATSGEAGFPLCSYLQSIKYCLGRNARDLAAKPSSRLSTNDKNLRPLFWRALFEKVVIDVYGSWPEDARVGRKISKGCNTFYEYCQKCFNSIGLQNKLTEMEITQFYETHKLKENQMVRFFFLKSSLAPVIETLINLDRLIYLHEQGFHNSHLLQVFDNKISPRCTAIVSVK